MNQTSDVYFDVEALTDLRAEVRLFQQLDLAYLVAGGTVVTALKISNYELPEVISGLWFVVVAFLCLAFIDYLIYSIVFFDWIAAKSGNLKRKSALLLARLANFQRLLHLIFIGGVISYALGYSTGSADLRNHLREHAFVQDQVDHFILIKKKVPTTIEELMQFSSSPYARSKLKNQFNEEPFLIEVRGKKNEYQLIFAGEDKRLGTSDDEVETSNVKLQKLLDIMREKEDPKNNGSDK